MLEKIMEDTLPPLFEMDNFTSCIKNENNLFCNIVATLTFPVNNNSMGEYIMKNVTENKQKFDRTLIHRGVCIAKNDFASTDFLKNYSSHLLNETKMNFTDISNIEIVTCTENNIPFSYFDQILLYGILGYLILITLATCYERTSIYKNSVNKGYIFFLVKSLSLTINWKKRVSVSKNPDFQNLLSMQAFRFILMLWVLFFHVLAVYNISFISNPTKYEKIMSYLYTPSFAFIVLPFFMFSSWLLTLQIYNHIKKQGKMTIKDVAIILLNRYFRLVLTVIVSLFIQVSSFLSRFRGPLTFTAINFNTEACRRNWMGALLFAGNFDKPVNMCNVVSWYLSADFQIYVINLLALYIKFKYKIQEVVFYPLLFIGSCVLYGYILNNHGYDIIYTMDVRHFEEYQFRSSPDWVVYYTSTYSNWACSIVGLIFGEIYYKSKGIQIHKNSKLTSLWALSSFISPIAAVVLSTRKTNGIYAAILGSIVKPMFNFGFGIGILGMAHSAGGIVKKVLEYKYFVLLGNFTFCTYLVHIFLLIIIHGRQEWPWDTSVYQIMKDYILLNLISWPLGVLVTLVVEEPGLSFQKRFLPQIKSKQIEEKKEQKLK